MISCMFMILITKRMPTIKNSCGFRSNFSMSQKFLSKSFVNISIRISKALSNKCLKLNSISITIFKILCFLYLIIAIVIPIIFTLSIQKPSFASESSFSVYPMDYQPLPIFSASISQISLFNLHSFKLIYSSIIWVDLITSLFFPFIQTVPSSQFHALQHE